VESRRPKERGRHPEVQEPGHHQERQRHPRDGPEAPSGLLDETRPKARVPQPAGRRHEDERDEEHAADPGHHRQDVHPADDEGHYEASPCPSARSAFRARTTIAAAAIFDQPGLDDGASPSFHRVGH
jgi:hypothetical protein